MVSAGDIVRYDDADWMVKHFVDDEQPAEAGVVWEQDPLSIWSEG